MAALKIVWFDFGGVLSPPIPELFAQYERKTGIAPAALQQAMQDVADDLGVPMLAPIENALISEEQWGIRLAEALRRNDPQLDLSRARLTRFGQQWFSGVQPNPAMREAARRLKGAGYQVGILTNNVVEWEPYWRELVDLDAVVDLIVDSSRERCRKPDARFFEIATQRSGRLPAQSLLIDDVAENIAAAAAQGWQTLHFIDNPGALDALEALTGVALRASEEALAS
ncbi:HAD family phosphatase [Pseudomonas sp. 273]|uniref:HAD family hydrolase n=1 Tax=Pseudomonas sp. 273 TaxID=75692 RepID=UPI0023D806E3|nr:HAD family phosphatase [Pseudomonas sp. 273]